VLNEPDDHSLFQHVADHVQSALAGQWHPVTNIERMEGVPRSVKAVWYLWWFAAEVGGGGLSSYVANCAPHAKEIIAAHDALVEVGARQLVELLEASFTPARSCNAEFINEQEAPWFEQFPANPKWASFEQIDPSSTELARRPLSSLVARYIRARRSEF
jgi:hypothetical protein